MSEECYEEKSKDIEERADDCEKDALICKILEHCVCMGSKETKTKFEVMRQIACEKLREGAESEE